MIATACSNYSMRAMDLFAADVPRGLSDPATWFIYDQPMAAHGFLAYMLEIYLVMAADLGALEHVVHAFFTHFVIGVGQDGHRVQDVQYQTASFGGLARRLGEMNPEAFEPIKTLVKKATSFARGDGEVFDLTDALSRHGDALPAPLAPLLSPRVRARANALERAGDPDAASVLLDSMRSSVLLDSMRLSPPSSRRPS